MYLHVKHLNQGHPVLEMNGIVKFCHFSSVHPQRVSRLECLVTSIARNTNLLQVIRLNVIFYGHSFSFFSTDLACIRSSFSTQDKVLAFLHHRFHLEVKIFQNPATDKGNCNCFGNTFLLHFGCFCKVYRLRLIVHSCVRKLS